MNQQRPKVSVPRSSIDNMQDLTSIIVMIGMFVYTIFSIYQMPPTIPTHYNGEGEVDGYGSSWTSIIMPFLTVVVYILLALVHKNPQIHNYPERLNEENAYAFYRNSKTLTGWIKLEIVCAFAYINWSFVQSALGKGLSIWYMFFILPILVLTVIVYLVRASHIK